MSCYTESKQTASLPLEHISFMIYQFISVEFFISQFIFFLHFLIQVLEYAIPPPLCTATKNQGHNILGNEKSYRESACVTTAGLSMAFQILEKCTKISGRRR